MKFDVDSLIKQARILGNDDQPNANPELQTMVGDPDDARISPMTQFKPNPGGTPLPDPNDPLQGDAAFFSLLIPGAIFADKNGQEWWIESYGSPDQIEITNRWYPRLGGCVSVADVRRSVYAFLEPWFFVVPPCPHGVTYGALPVRVVNDEEGDKTPSNSFEGIGSSGASNSSW